ncbi:hypothetical protein Tco_0406047, partial [Tanacetum coccineum]
VCAWGALMLHLRKLLRMFPTAFPSTNFPFLSKVDVAVGVSEVVNIQPDKIVRSATPTFVPAATLYSNEAFNRTSTPEEPKHALDVSSSLV